MSERLTFGIKQLTQIHSGTNGSQDLMPAAALLLDSSLSAVQEENRALGFSPFTDGEVEDRVQWGLGQSLVCGSHALKSDFPCPLPGHPGRPVDFFAVPPTPSFGREHPVLCKGLMFCTCISPFRVLSSSADAAALISQRCPPHPTPKRWSGPGSGVGPPRGGHSGALLLRCRAAGRVGAGSTKPGAGTGLGLLCLLNLILIREKTSNYMIRKRLKLEKALALPGLTLHSLT